MARRKPPQNTEPPPDITEIGKGHPVKIRGERQTITFKFMKLNEKDDSVTVWGGDKDPTGYIAMRTYPKDRIIVLPKPREQ